MWKFEGSTSNGLVATRGTWIHEYMNEYTDTHKVNNRKTFFSNPDCYIDYEIIASGFQKNEWSAKV